MPPKCDSRPTRRWPEATAAPMPASLVSGARCNARLNKCANEFWSALLMLRLNVGKLREAIRDYDGFRTVGRLRSATGLVTSSLQAAIGDQCEIIGAGRSIAAEVIGFVGTTTQLAPYE